MPAPVYPGVLARLIRKTLGSGSAAPARCDQPQSNGAWCVHQVRVRLPGDPTLYRVIVAPADAPIAIGGVPADEHFLEPIADETIKAPLVEPMRAEAERSAAA